DALRPALPRRRRGSYRPADRSEGPEPRRRRRAHVGRGPRRLVRRPRDGGARRLLRHMSAPRLPRGALLVLDDIDAAQDGRRRLRAAAAAFAAALRHELEGGRDVAGRELRRPHYDGGLMLFDALFVPKQLREAVGGRAWVQAMLDAEAALARAQASAGV